MSSPLHIPTLVDRGLAIRKKLNDLKLELKTIEDTLKSYGLTQPHEDLKDADRDGRRWLALGTEDAIPVIFTADKLIGSFQDGGREHLRISGVAGMHFTQFFRPVKKWENQFDDGKKFRATAADILGTAAPKFVTSCLSLDKAGIPKSDIRIEWDSPEPIP